MPSTVPYILQLKAIGYMKNPLECLPPLYEIGMHVIILYTIIVRKYFSSVQAIKMMLSQNNYNYVHVYMHIIIIIMTIIIYYCTKYKHHMFFCK